MKQTEWIRCPVCGSKIRDKVREDTVLKNKKRKILGSFIEYMANELKTR